MSIENPRKRVTELIDALDKLMADDSPEIVAWVAFEYMVTIIVRIECGTEQQINFTTFVTELRERLEKARVAHEKYHHPEQEAEPKCH